MAKRGKKRSASRRLNEKKKKYLEFRAIHLVFLIIFAVAFFFVLFYSLLASSPSTINIFSPAANSTVNSSTVVFNASVHDSSSIENVSVYVNGSLFATNYSGINDVDYVFSGSLKEGNYTFYYRMCDLNNCTVSQIYSFSVVPLDLWSMFMKDSEHSDYYPGNLDVTHFTKMWNSTTWGAVESSPAALGPYVYAGDQYGLVYEFNETNGNYVWITGTGGPVDTSSPAISDGRLFIGSSDMNMYAFNITNGNKLWNYTAGDDPSFSPPAVSDGKVFFGAEDGLLYSLNATTGILIWSQNTGGGIETSPIVSKGVVYSGSTVNSIFAFNETDGSQIWNFSTYPDSLYNPSLFDGVIFFGSANDNIYALNATTGQKIWNRTTGGAVEGSVAKRGSLVFSGSANGKMYALNATNGDFVWNYTLGTPVYGSPAVTKNGVLVFQSNGVLYALNATNGNLLLKYDTGARPSAGYESSVSISNGMIFMGGNDYNMYAFGTDFIPPVVQALSPGDNYTSLSSSLTFAGTVSDNLGVSNFSLYVDNSPVQTNSSGLNNSLYTFTANNVSDGNHTWFLRGCDSAKNCVDSPEENFIVDTHVPNISQISPPENHKSNSFYNVFSGFVSDKSGVANVSVYVDNSLLGSNSSGTNDANYSFSFPVEEGNHTWFMEACNIDSKCVNTSARNFSVDSTKPKIQFVSPTLASGDYDRLYIPVNISASDLHFKEVDVRLYSPSVLLRTVTSYSPSFLFWNLTGISYGTYYMNATALDTYGNSNSTETRILRIYPLSINDSILPYAAVKSATVFIRPIALGQQSIRVNITNPDGVSQTLPVTNNIAYAYTNTSILGRYNVTFYANDSSGNEVLRNDYFEVFNPYVFNFSVIDSNGNGVDSSGALYYRGKEVSSASSSSGKYSQEVPDTPLDMMVSAYGGDLKVLIRGVNVDSENDRSIGVGNPTRLSGDLADYAVSNPYTFKNATVYISYNNSYYTNESDLRIYKCDPYDFAKQSCSGIWKDMTSQSSANFTTHALALTVDSFSGFAIRQGQYCGDGLCSSSESCSTCSIDCGSCSAPISSTSSGGGGYSCSYDPSFNWQCSLWNGCVNGTQNRTCLTSNNCGGTYGMPVTNRTCAKKLFDIEMTLQNPSLQNSSDLTAIVKFTNFGNVPTFVSLTYAIFNSRGNEIYHEDGNITVQTEDAILKTFPDLNLSRGRYNLVLTTVYGDNVTDQFRQPFSIGVISIQGIVSSKWGPVIFIVMVAVLVALIFFVIYLIRRNSVLEEDRNPVRKRGNKGGLSR